MKQSSLDQAAIGLSLACAVHCLLLPIALVMVPTLAASTVGDEHFHQWMLLAVVPTSLLALTMGCRRHRNLGVAVMGLSGLAILGFAALLGHALLGESGEKIASLLGASLISVSHFKNHTLCRDLQCGCDADNG